MSLRGLECAMKLPFSFLTGWGLVASPFCIRCDFAELRLARRACRSINDEELGTRAGRRAVGGVAEVRDLIALARGQCETAPIAQFGIELALQHEEHVTSKRADDSDMIFQTTAEAWMQIMIVGTFTNITLAAKPRHS